MKRRTVLSQGQLKEVLSCLVLLSVCFIATAVTNASLSKTIDGNSLSTGSAEQPNPNLSLSSSAFSLAPEPGRSPDALWQFMDEAPLIEKQKERIIAPQAYKAVQLNQDALTALLSQAPLEFTDEAARKQVVLTLPMPNGELAGFRVDESPIMEQALAALYPEIKTYSGQGIDDPTAMTRFDWTPLGLHAIVLSSDGTAFIEPVSPSDTATYISYFNHDVSTENLTLSCLLSDKEIADAEQRGIRLNQGPAPSAFTTGTTLRTYRLAVAATGEFTQQYGGGNVNTTLTQITTLVNQINALYRKEATITFQLIANETSIIFTDPVTDGYTNGSPSTMLAENQTKLDAVIGSANYDIGHVFGGITVGPGSFSFSGVANVGVVCTSGNKARGVSTMGGASSSFPHSIFVSGTTHEMAHQFSAPHSFNSTTSGCAGQRSAAGAYEPGSGSTIMGYSICGTDNLQTLPDLYFHTGSLEQVVTYAAGAGNCAATAATGNNPPAISTLSNFTIPANTPFTLTATATDPNGDAITGGWEEFDLGAASPPNTDDGTRPIVRSFIPASSTSRTFPKLQYILNNANVPPASYSCGSGTCLTGELLPSTTSTMNFRFTARENRAAGGGTARAPMQASVVSTAGPFAVTQPNTAVSWSGGSSQTVTWSVNGTNLAPVSCASVKISLSTDGGNTFTITVATTTPNDGTETIVVPNVSTTAARIRVEAVGNVFFDISDTNFTIVSSQTSTLTVDSSNPASGVSVTVSPNDNSGQGSGVTQFTRVYNTNTNVSLTAPSTAAGNNFQKWQLDGVDLSTSLTASLAMGANHTMTAVYVTAPPPTRTLTVASSNPSSGVGITVSPNDNNGQGNGATQFTRVYNNNTVVNLTAPLTAGGNNFQKWQLDGVDFTTFITATFGMGTDHTMTAVYVTATARKTPFDFDGDGRTDLSIFRPSDLLWYIIPSSTGSSRVQGWGFSTDVLVPGDYDGDGKTDLAVWRPSDGFWYIINSSTGAGRAQGWGVSTDIPVPGDYDGDGKTDLAIWRPSEGTWYIINSSTGIGRVQGWGLPGDKPVPSDYDGDGKTDLAVWRPSDGFWYIINSSTGGGRAQGWGLPTDKLVPGDYDGDGKTDLAVWRPSNGFWYIINSSTGAGRAQEWGLSTDKPVPGDYDGDGKTDLAVWRPSDGTWYIINSSTGGGRVQGWGL